MKILAIETSCDETAIALVNVSEKKGKTTEFNYKIAKEFNGIYTVIIIRLPVWLPAQPFRGGVRVCFRASLHACPRP
jgi:hypothetical protein